MSNTGLLLIHLATTWCMTGLIWFVQVVHYPLMQWVGREGFIAYSRRHQSRTSLVVGPPMLVELLTAGLLLTMDSECRRSSLYLISCGLLVVIWTSTALWQMPYHKALLDGFDAARVDALVRSNWIRTVAWTGRATIVTWLFWQRMHAT